MLDADRPYPYGSADAATGEPMCCIEAFLALPILVMVGELDTSRDDGLRTSTRLDRVQGENRLQRALRWVDHLESEGAGLDGRCRRSPSTSFRARAIR